MFKQDDHFSYKNCYQYGSFINVNEYIDKNLIIYETGIHYMNIINKKRKPPYEQNYIQSFKRVAPL